MTQPPKNPRWLKSRAYRKAKSAVTKLIISPKALLSLIERAAQKSEKSSTGLVGRSLESVKVMIRLTAAFARGEYRDVATENMVLIVAALLYFVMPLDALPDFIAMLGLTDDVALLAWTWGKVKDEVERFLTWELQQEQQVSVEQNQPAQQNERPAGGKKLLINDSGQTE